MSEKLEKDLDQNQEETNEEVGVRVEDSELVDNLVEDDGQDEDSSVSNAGSPSPLLGISLETYEQLTNRSQDFMFQLNRLIEDKIADEDLIAIYQEMVETLLVSQSSGQTARQLYGTASECAQLILEGDFLKEGEEENTTPSNRDIIIDGGLAMGSVYTIIVGISMLTAKGDQANNMTYMGLISTLISYIMAGVAMMMTYKNMPDFDAPRGKRGYPRYFIMSILGMILWFGSVTLTAVFLPPAINPVMPGWFYVVLGLGTFGLRWLLKKYKVIKGNIF